MKRLILILLCLPFFLFSQEKKKYEKTMSISQFAEELKEAADQGIDYTLENCEITYDPVRDKQYVITNTGDKDFEADALIKDIHFPDTNIVNIENCTFGKKHNVGGMLMPSITFQNCQFGEFKFHNTKESRVIFDSIIATQLEVSLDTTIGFSITNSTIKYLQCINSSENIIENLSGWTSFSSVDITANTIGRAWIDNINMIDIRKNNFDWLRIHGQSCSIYIKENTFRPSFNILQQISQSINWLKNKKYDFFLWNRSSCEIYSKNIASLSLKDNKFLEIESTLQKDTLIKIIKSNNTDIYQTWTSWYNEDTSVFNLMIQDHEIKERMEKEGKCIPTEQIELLEKYIKKNDSLEIKYKSYASLTISPGNVNKLFLSGDTINIFSLSDVNIKEHLSINNIYVKKYINLSNLSLPEYRRIKLDKIFIDKLGFKLDEKTFYGTENYAAIKENNIPIEDYNNRLEDQVSSLKLLIEIFQANGSSLSNDAIYKLKDTQKNQKMCEYYQDANVNTWFNWRGTSFLKWYSDYGMNPFKALTYCFWAMLYFALFYFFFYSEWDQIDRGFLIKRFNSVMDYFTTEKRIQDFYSSSHDQEMTTFTEFKETLDKNKVYMPSMLASLAKPIYQMSLFRYKLLNFSYKKAEFMAGRKWVDLEKKDRYWIGALTFFLTLTYIIYLVFIRALNSIVLSINAFSTLGFGQIPVRGFTKYVAIIEGFIGWFMLSVFIVSLLSQMMSV